jgi:hypothetical protein
MEAKNKKLMNILRRCLNSRFILRFRSRDLFDNLSAQLDPVNEYFSQIGAEVVLDNRLGIAYVRELAELEGKDIPQLGRKSEFSPYETVTLLFLRKKRMDYFSGEVKEEHPIVTKKEVKDFLETYKTGEDDSKFQSKLDKVIKNLSYWQVLHKKGTNTYEISPVCEILLTAEAIKAMQAASEKYFENIKKVGQTEELKVEV